MHTITLKNTTTAGGDMVFRVIHLYLLLIYIMHCEQPLDNDDLSVSNGNVNFRINLYYILTTGVRINK